MYTKYKSNATITTTTTTAATTTTTTSSNFYLTCLSLCLSAVCVCLCLSLSLSVSVETGEYVVSLQFLCNRKKILKLVLDKSSRSLTTQHMRLAIRTIFSPRFPSHASLMLNFTPYVVEQTKWPQRFCRLSVHLKIPPNCVVPMTVYHTCTLTFSVHVSSSHPIGKKNDLLDYQYPLKYNFRVPEGNSELVVTDIQTVRHTSLFDATCKNIKFEIFGKLDFEEVAMPEYHFIDPQDDNGFVEIVPNK